MTIARVFPRKTNASPDDALAFFGEPPKKLHKGISEVRVSVSFTYDLAKAEVLAKKWSRIAPVSIGGPALGDRGGVFTPGLYLKRGFTITSRGCPNRCWFCDVWKREGSVRELPIKDGYVLQDSNLLACSDGHIRRVFRMLARQKNRAQFTGGLEAKRLRPWIVDELWTLRPEQMFFAYDTPDDLDPLIEAGRLLRYADFTRRHLRCYVLIGHPRDTFADAENRLVEAWSAGFLPMAMLWRDKAGKTTEDWRRFQKLWARPAIIKARLKGTTWLL